MAGRLRIVRGSAHGVHRLEGTVPRIAGAPGGVLRGRLTGGARPGTDSPLGPGAGLASVASPDVTATDAHRPLPRGPHDLSREEVAASQRQRMVGAMADAVAEKGYAKTAVNDVLKRAGVSRATFYEQFSDKEDCFRAAFEAIAGMLAEVLATQLAYLAEAKPELDALGRVDAILSLYLEVMRQAPNMAKTFLIEVYAAGPAAIEQRRQSIEGFVDLVVEALDGAVLPGDATEQRFTVQAMVGAIASLVTNMVGAGEVDRVPELREPIMSLVRRLVDQP